MPAAYTFTIDNLTLMKWSDDSNRKHRLHLIDEISPKWKEASDLLGLSTSRTGSIEMTHRDARTCCREVMAEWLNHADGVYNYPATWEGLCELLNDLNLSCLSKQLHYIVNL